MVGIRGVKNYWPQMSDALVKPVNACDVSLGKCTKGMWTLAKFHCGLLSFLLFEIRWTSWSSGLTQRPVFCWPVTGEWGKKKGVNDHNRGWCYSFFKIWRHRRSLLGHITEALGVTRISKYVKDGWMYQGCSLQHLLVDEFKTSI